MPTLLLKLPLAVPTRLSIAVTRLSEVRKATSLSSVIVNGVLLPIVNVPSDAVTTLAASINEPLTDTSPSMPLITGVESDTSTVNSRSPPTTLRSLPPTVNSAGANSALTPLTSTVLLDTTAMPSKATVPLTLKFASLSVPMTCVVSLR